MDLVFSGIHSDILSNEASRQSAALLIALQLAASGKDISSLAPSLSSNIICSNSRSPVVKKLAYDCIRHSRLTADEWETVCTGLSDDFRCPDPEVTAASVSFLTALPSWRITSFLSDHKDEISHCISHSHASLRLASVESLGSLLARDDIVSQCASSLRFADTVTAWWAHIGLSALDPSDAVSSAAFTAISRLFSELTSHRLSRLAGDKLTPSESSTAVRSRLVSSMVHFVWTRRDLLMSRASLLPLDFLTSALSPLVYSAKHISAASATQVVLGVSDLVSFLLPLLSSSLDPALVYEASVHLLSLSSLPGGKPEWSSAPMTALLALWDRRQYSPGREALVQAVVSHLPRLELHLQVRLVRKLLALVRGLRVEADRMHALACICRVSLTVDAYVRESARRGQRPMEGTGIGDTLLGADPTTQAEFASPEASGLFREELLACLVESTLQLGQGGQAVVWGGGEGEVEVEVEVEAGGGWSACALEVVEVCRVCLLWRCEGRSYAQDCYLRLLVQLCRVFDTAGGVREGGTPEVVQAEHRLQALHRQLLDTLDEVVDSRVRVRLLWVLAEHLDLSTSNALFADEPREPLNILIRTVQRSLTTDTDAQDVEAILVCAQHLGSRSFRAASLVCCLLEDLRTSPRADAVLRHRCQLALRLLATCQRFPQHSWSSSTGPTGEYPFTHHQLSVAYHSPAAALDRKMEQLVRGAVRGPAAGAPGGAVGAGLSWEGAASGRVMSGSSDPVLVEASHLTDAAEHRVTLHMKVWMAVVLAFPLLMLFFLLLLLLLLFLLLLLQLFFCYASISGVKGRRSRLQALCS